MQGALRRYDRHRRRVLMSELLPAPSRTFQLAYQVALMDDAGTIDRLIKDQAFSGREARGLARITLANYLAGLEGAAEATPVEDRRDQLKTGRDRLRQRRRRLTGRSGR